MLVKEEVVEFLVQGNIKVSRQDYQFFTNLLKFCREKRVTTGQDKLLNKLLDKYKRQLNKQGYKSEELQLVPWHQKLVETKIEFQQAHLSINNDKLVLRSPFSKKFISQLSDLQKITFNILDWDKKDKVYVGTLSNFALKNLLPILFDCFDNVVLSDNIKEIIDDVKQYKDYIWDPTLVRINNRYYVIACNEMLYEQIKDINLDNSPQCLFELSTMGIGAHNNIVDDDAKKFATTYYAEADLIELDKLATYLKELGVNIVFGSAVIKKSLQYIFTKYNIEIKPNDNLPNDLHMYKHIICLQHNSSKKSRPYYLDNVHVSKIVVIKNSMPVILNV